MTFRAVPDLWKETDAPSESVIAYMATSKRLWSDQPDIDLTICALEAAARQPPHHQSLLKEGLSHPNPLVQDTASRLLALIKK